MYPNREGGVKCLKLYICDQKLEESIKACKSHCEQNLPYDCRVLPTLTFLGNCLKLTRSDLKLSFPDLNYLSFCLRL